MISLIKASLENVVVSPNIGVSKKIGGATNIKLTVDGLPFRPPSENKVMSKNAGKIRSIVLISFNNFAEGEVIFVCSKEFKYLVKLGYIKKYGASYKLNKKKVRSKIMAYSQLDKSRKFMAFYSISFPAGLDDFTIRQIHNTALTRIRKYRKSFTYIWIAERQANGTLHFHMLTNEWLNIRITNHIYKAAIKTQIKKQNLTHIKFDDKKYNGVDVKPVKNIQGLSKYLAKYVTKNDYSYNGLAWNCDKTISALVTHLYLDSVEFKKIESKLIYVNTFTKKNESNGYTTEFDIYDYGGYKPKIIFATIKEINQYIVKSVIN